MNKNCPVPICPSCKNYEGTKALDDKVIFCKAFPEGIPFDYMFGSKAAVNTTCQNEYGFEDVAEKDAAATYPKKQGDIK